MRRESARRQEQETDPMIEKLAEEAKRLSKHYRWPENMHKALDSFGVKNRDLRTRYLQAVGKKLGKRPVKPVEPRTSTVFTNEQMERMLREAEIMERSHPKETDD